MKLFNKLKLALLGSSLSIGVAVAINANAVIQTKAEESVTTVTDVITADKLPATSTTYKPFNDLVFSLDSKAKYSGSSSKITPYINLSNKKSNGIFSSSSGGKLKSVSVTFPENSSKRKLNVVTSSSSFSGISDLFADTATISDSIDLTLTTSPTEDASIYSYTTIFDDDSVRYVGFAAVGGAIQLSSISITWELTTFGTLDSIEVTNPGKTDFVVGETYSSSDIVAIKKDKDGNQENISSSDIKTSLDGHVFTEEDVPSVKNKVIYNGKESGEFEIKVSSLPTFKKVTANKEDWTGTYLITAIRDDGTIIAMNSASSSLGSKGDYGVVTDTDGNVKATLGMAFTINKIDDSSYSVKTSNGLYIYCGSTSSNDISTKSSPMPITISFDGTITMKSGDATLVYNKHSSSDSFKFFQTISSNSLPITLYEYQAPVSESLTAWANQINNTLTCDNGNTAPSVETWNDIKSNYFDSKISGVDLETIRSETGNANGTVLQQALAKYDYIVSKYGDSTYSNYLGRNLVIVNKSQLLNNHSISSSSLITIISILGVGSCIGTFLLLRRKKEN